MNLNSEKKNLKIFKFFFFKFDLNEGKSAAMQLHTEKQWRRPCRTVSKSFGSQTRYGAMGRKAISRAGHHFVIDDLFIYLFIYFSVWLLLAVALLSESIRAAGSIMTSHFSRLLSTNHLISKFFKMFNLSV